ncbi:hypothetical protein SASPL_131015 [Salvia splendens]|uniref:Uncharacterized protein n=1 Tax=Salvia splendens TaxID=180675 RepID=A0A8X8ZKL9_SALSN|nr:hypothetical protein SASPL_131015 [Salvia splendens]
MAYEAWSYGERGMKILSKRDLLLGHKVRNLVFCEHYVFGKLHRNKFSKKGVHLTKGTLDYIHMDCWDPSRAESIGEDSDSVDKQVELQVTHDESESQLQGGEDQHTTAGTTSSDIHPKAHEDRCEASIEQS